MLKLSNIRLISLLIPLAIMLHMYQPKFNVAIVDESVVSVVETIKEVTSEQLDHTERKGEKTLLKWIFMFFFVFKYHLI